MYKSLIVCLCFNLFLLAACGQPIDIISSPLSNGGEETIINPASDPVQAAEEGLEPSAVTWDEERVPEIVLAASEDDWNTWMLEVPVHVKNSTTCLRIQFSLPTIWEPECREYQHAVSGYPKYDYFFIERQENGDTLDKFSLLSIYDNIDNQEWMEDPNKLERIEYLLPPISGGEEGSKFNINNYISTSYQSVGDARWLLYCGFYSGYTVSPKLEGMNFCNAYTVYDDRYQLAFQMDLREHTLEDEDTKALLMAILESWEILAVEAVS